MHIRSRGGDISLPLNYFLNHSHHDADEDILDDEDDADIDDNDSNATTLPWGEEQGNRYDIDNNYYDDTHTHQATTTTTTTFTTTGRTTKHSTQIMSLTRASLTTKRTL